MNNAAIIGRQLRRQKHYRGSYQIQNISQKKKKRNYIAELRERITVDCVVRTCKAFSIGLFVFSLGLSMMVVGFYAEPLSTYFDVADNGTKLFHVNSNQRTGLEYLTYIGPVIMGIGGITLAAAYVFAFGMRESPGARIVPITEERLTGVDSLFKSKPISEHEMSEQIEQPKDQTTGLRMKSLTKPEISPVVILKPSRVQQIFTPDAGERATTSTH